MLLQDQLSIETRPRSSLDISAEVESVVRAAGIGTGLCHVFVHHTSASLMITENADPSVRRDLEYFMRKTAIDGDPGYQHDLEGPDDMSAHIRSVLTGSDLMIPVSNGRLALGTWQGIFLWEHRTRPHRRRITVTIQGE
jgi:secondary thiamine-phosphate synthase enzyme